MSVRHLTGLFAAGIALSVAPAMACDPAGCRPASTHARTVILPPHVARHLLRAPVRPPQLSPEAAQAYALSPPGGVRMVSGDEFNEIDQAAPALASDSAARIVAMRFPGTTTFQTIRRGPDDLRAGARDKTESQPTQQRTPWRTIARHRVAVSLKTSARAASGAVRLVMAALP